MISMLFTAQVVLAQPRTELFPAQNHTMHSVRTAALSGLHGSSSTTGVIQHEAYPSHEPNRSTSLISRAVDAWMRAKPLPRPFPEYDAGYDQSPTAPNLAPAVSGTVPEWLDKVDFLFDAGEVLRDATSFEAPGMHVRLDPFNLRCTFTFKLNGSPSTRGK